MQIRITSVSYSIPQMHLAYKSQYTKLTWPSKSGIAIGKERKQEVSRDRTRAINPNTVMMVLRHATAQSSDRAKHLSIHFRHFYRSQVVLTNRCSLIYSFSVPTADGLTKSKLNLQRIDSQDQRKLIKKSEWNRMCFGMC